MSVFPGWMFPEETQIERITRAYGLLPWDRVDVRPLLKKPSKKRRRLVKAQRKQAQRNRRT